MPRRISKPFQPAVVAFAAEDVKVFARSFLATRAWIEARERAGWPIRRELYFKRRLRDSEEVAYVDLDFYEEVAREREVTRGKSSPNSLA